ncbi:MAG TPA: hypothetical protein VME43_00570 [Bryobacteraceae bacterium]|nr:hypothetical protein [Bryobacteraceae bacterium]
MNNLSAITETAVEFGKEAKESIEKLARSAEKLAQSAKESLDQKRGDAGGALHLAASSIRDAGQKSAKTIDDLSSGAADKLHSTASYIEQTDVRGMLTGFASRHPAPSLVVAAAVGFFVGSALMRMRR